MQKGIKGRGVRVLCSYFMACLSPLMKNQYLPLRSMLPRASKMRHTICVRLSLVCVHRLILHKVHGEMSSKKSSCQVLREVLNVPVQKTPCTNFVRIQFWITVSRRHPGWKADRLKMRPVQGRGQKLFSTRTRPRFGRWLSRSRWERSSVSCWGSPGSRASPLPWPPLRARKLGWRDLCSHL